MNYGLVLVLAALWLAMATMAGRTLLRIGGVTACGRFESLVLSVAIGFAFGAYVVIGFAQIGWLSTPMAWTVLGILALLSIPTLRRQRPREWWVWVKERLGVFRVPGWRRWLLLSLAAVFAVSATLNLISVLAPPTEWDTLTYHLAEPSYFIRQGRMSFVPYREWPTPLTAEMWNMVALLLGSDRLAQVFQWSMGLAAAGALYVLAAPRTSRSVGLLAAVVFYTSPHVLSLATSAKSDLAWMTFFFLTLHTLLLWRERGDIRWLWLSAMLLGLTLATKFQGLFGVPAIGLLLLFMQGEDWKRVPVRALGRVVVYGIVVGVVASPWWIRNWVGGGDPLWPYGYPVFHSDFWSQELHDKYASWSQGPGQGIGHYFAGLWNLTVNQSAWQFGLRLPITPVLLALLPFVVLLWARVSSKTRWFFVALTAAALVHYTIWFETYQQTRYLFPVLAVLMIPSAYAALHLVRNTAPRFVVGGLLAASLVFFFGYNIFYNAQFVPVVAGSESEEAFLVRKVSYYQDLQWLDQNLPSDAKVLFYPLKTYYLDRDFVRGDENLWEISESTTPEDYLRFLRERRVTHVFAASDVFATHRWGQRITSIIKDLKSSGDLKAVYTNHEAIVVESRTLAQFDHTLVEVLEVMPTSELGRVG
ncbi:MAG: hypothetical protein FJ312_03910 [SAR202 cluster bacterium]|nr:hypothetical protein [SAR202 cluster bacterium]